MGQVSPIGLTCPIPILWGNSAMRFLCLSLAVLVTSASAFGEPPRISVAYRAEAGIVEVKGIDDANLAALDKAKWSAEEWQTLLLVKLFKGTADEQRARPGLLGEYRLRGKVVEF